MRKNFLRTTVVLLLLLMTCSTSFAREGLWRKVTRFLMNHQPGSVGTRAAIFFTGHEGRWTHLIAWTVLFATSDKDNLAMAAARRALQVAEATTAGDNARVATSLNYLAALYDEKAKYVEAEQLVRRALAIREKSLGAEDPAVADEVIKLARLCSKQHKFAVSEPLYSRALNMREKALGVNKAPVADVLNELATQYASERRYADAEKLYHRALEIERAALGAEDLNVADTLDALAAMHVEEGHYAEAEGLYRQALEMQVKASDLGDPTVVPTLEGWATLCQKQGKATEALRLRQQAAQIREEALGRLSASGKHDRELKRRLAELLSHSFSLYDEAEHFDKIRIDQKTLRFVEAYFGVEDWRVSVFLVVLAEQYWSGQGAYSKAEPLYRRALRIQEKRLGTEDPSLAETLTQFGELYAAERKYEDAEAVLQRAIGIQEKALRIEAPEDSYMHNPRALLAQIYGRRGRSADAEMLLQTAVHIQESATGSKKPKSFAIARLLMTQARLYEDQGKLDCAEPLVRRAMSLDGNAWEWGWTSFNKHWLSEDLRELARIYVRFEKYGEAEPLYQRALALSTKANGLRSAYTATAEWDLAATYVLEEKYAQAEALLQQALRRQQQMSLAWQVANTSRNLAWVYISQGKYPEAKELLAQSLKIEEANLDPDSPELADTLTGMGIAMFGLAQPDRGQPFFDTFRVPNQSLCTKAVDWKGGGGFRYYRLAPSLLEKDKWGNWVISKQYNSAMLAEALCKLEGFVYAPSETLYWQHGNSTERDFIYVTTQNLSPDQLQQLSDEVGPERTLLVLCTAFRGKAERWTNLTVKKIPRAVLSRCEWGHDDYSLSVENLPKAPPKPGQQSLFADGLEND